MEFNRIETGKAPAPVGPYSQAVRAGGFVFCSGQIALDPVTGELDNNTIENETARAMDNLKAVLEAADTSFERVVKTTIFLTDMNDFGRVNTIYADYFSTDTPPARACIEVAALPKGACVEIECVALD